ncbi:MAG: pyridoxal 5'-phosphate synthase glutaminase subunit PdxT [Proteobacteria bacterium]|nr:pyridoxal 5'-phosphate synthase glutaminase subunit PdxT [Pseudomonadota bacterium]
MTTDAPCIGVLALQGDVSEHVRAIEAAGGRALEVRDADGLERVHGLVIPGGESTTVGMLLTRFALLEPLRRRIERGLPVYGTCTGLILLSRAIDDGLEGQPHLGCLDVRVRRNGYGRQLQSFEADIEMRLGGDVPAVVRAVFIRAPKIVATGGAVEVLAWHDGVAVAVRQGSLLATSFHPELTRDCRVHALFVEMCRAAVPISS